MTEKTNPAVRALRESDKPEWSALWTAYLEFYETSRPAEIHDLYFTRLLGNDPRDFNCIVAEADGRLVGLAHYLFHRHGWSEADTCYLQDLYADPAVRGQGIGRALIEAVYAAADEAGAGSVYWLTQDFNTTARQLYDRIGVKTPFIRYNRK